jgi:hypothetical protein
VWIDADREGWRERERERKRANGMGGTGGGERPIVQGFAGNNAWGKHLFQFCSDKHKGRREGGGREGGREGGRRGGKGRREMREGGEGDWERESKWSLIPTFALTYIYTHTHNIP